MSDELAYKKILNDPVLKQYAYDAANHFVHDETPFHLGFLPTEQSHVLTEDLALSDPGRDVRKAARTAVDRILAVDNDLAPVARRVVLDPAFDSLVEALRAVRNAPLDHNAPRICFSGCGSTGRLAIILEAMWRRFFKSGNQTNRVDQACSIMTGGDRALIRAVENFEDYSSFGAQQVADLDLGQGDVLVAISEGGETSSVIGTAWEALRRGCHVFFVYNNPTPVLVSGIERSRELIEHPDVTVLDLYTGPMALGGSTRMQATTIEMLILGIALEESLAGLTGSSRLDRVDSFVRLLRSLANSENRNVIRDLAVREASLYEKGGRVTYFAEEYLLDIFSDTTERSPTFMLPPFRAQYDILSPVSWAFAKDPARPTIDAWHYMLGREPRGIDWDRKTYEDIGAPPTIVESPPKLDLAEIHAYQIGNEHDDTRWECTESLALWVVIDEILPVKYKDRLESPRRWSAQEMLQIFSTRNEERRSAPSESREFRRIYRIDVDLQTSPINLFHHLAVKLIFNTFSTASMALLGRIYHNWMIQLDPTNKKLIDRGSRIIAELAGIEYADACYELYRSIAARNMLPDDHKARIESPVRTTLGRLGVL